jgi:FtsH-binding integral membrane protein
VRPEVSERDSGARQDSPNPKKMAGWALEAYPLVSRANRIEVRLTLPMSTVNVERVRPALSPEKKLSATTLTGRNGILQRYFYFAMSLLLAAIVVVGFKRTVDHNLFHPAVPRPFILWIHASAFSGWVIFFICQFTLVRIRKVSWHRSIGWFGAGLATVMVPLGIATAIVMARFDTVQLHQNQNDADAFLSIPFYDMIAFGVCIALAIYWRTKPELHRRLVFIATCGLMDAAVARFDYVFDHNLFFPCLDLLIVLGVGRDLLVDRRIHKVYLYALPLLMMGQTLAVYMWRHNPSWWQGITRVIMG